MTELKLHRRRGIGLAALALLLAQGVQATTMRAPTAIEDLTIASDLVVHGRLQNVSTRIEGEQVFTHVDVQIEETLKGSAERSVEVRLYGGTANGLTTRILGAPCLGDDEEVVLFLLPNGESTYGIVNLAEGKFAVVDDGTDSAQVVRDTSELYYVEAGEVDVPETLAELKTAVRTAAEGHGS